MPNTDHMIAPRSQFGRSVVLPLTVLVVAAIVIVVAFVLVTAQHQDSEARRLSIRLAQTALATKKENVARNLKDYAFWQDAFDNLHTKVNTDWAATDGNVGANIYNSLGYEMAFVLSPKKQTVYAIEEGKPLTMDAMTRMPAIQALLPEAAKGGPATVSVLRMGDGLVVAGASAILPPNPIDAPPPEGRSIMVFVDRIDDALLTQISHNYLLRNLRLQTDKPLHRLASLPLLDQGGVTLGYLVWSPDRPGLTVMRSVLPPLGGVLAVMLAFAVVVLRNARRSALALQHSADTIEAYARTLKVSEERFRDVAEASSDWIWETDTGLRFTYVSDRIGTNTSLHGSDLVGSSLSDFFASDTTTDGWAQLRGQLACHQSFRDLLCCYSDASGHHRTCRIAGRPIIASDGTFAGYRGTASDVTAEVEAHDRANHLALHDPLTGLPNRILLKERLNVALDGGTDDSASTAVLCLDLDHFKDVNDTLGHAAGDILLQQLARRLQGRVRGIDTVARLGGDEFAIVQVGLDQPATAEALCRNLLEDFRSPFLVDGSELFIGVSIGIALSPEDGSNQDELLKHADLALYRAKQAGRSTFRFFEQSMDTELQARKFLEQDLRRALVRNELELHYQPLISLDGDELKGVEALLRWTHETRGAISPGDFIPLAEETGMIVAIGEWVLRTACVQANQWPGLLMAVNVSAVQFKHREFVELVRQVLDDTGLAPGRLELEITEGVLLYDTAAAFETLTQLKDLGVRIAMDDFGTGYSSLGYLNSFPFDKIKIDRSFIRQVAEADKSSAIVRSVITLGQSLSMVTIAEGVETDEQLAFLRTEGCDQVQGYIFGFPLPPSEFTALWSERCSAFSATQQTLPDLARADLTLPPPVSAEAISVWTDVEVSPMEGTAAGTADRFAASPGPLMLADDRPPLAVTASQGRELARAIAFARCLERPLNVMVTLEAPLGPNGRSAAAAVRKRLMMWFERQADAAQTPGWFAVWAAEQRASSASERCHILLHCPAGAARRRLRRTLARWGRDMDIRVEALPLPTGPGTMLLTEASPFAPLLSGIVLAQSSTRASRSCGRSASLSRQARVEWRAAARMATQLCRAAAKLRAAQHDKVAEPTARTGLAA